LQGDGIRIIGTADEAKRTLYDADLTGPLAVAMGFEGSGLRRLTRERCDEFVRIPMAGAVECLNVSVATGVLPAGLFHRPCGRWPTDRAGQPYAGPSFFRSSPGPPTPWYLNRYPGYLTAESAETAEILS
jgi:hypothetical protein